MNRADIQKRIERACPDLDRETVQEFFSRMDPDYFSLYTPQEIGEQMRMSSRLNPEHPVEVRIRPRRGDRYEILIVAFDYFYEFSIITGLLAAFGLDIQSGEIYTFSREEPRPARPGPGDQRKRPVRSSPARIVDHFRVALRPGESFHAVRQKAFEQELRGLLRLLGENRHQEARERVNRRLIERLEKMQGRFASALYPIEVRFDNRLSDQWTVVNVHSKDTPAFLYAFSNALSMRSIYIHKVRIESLGTEVRDQFYISDRKGRKIEEEKEQEALRLAVVWIKQFTHYLPSAPDPSRAIRYFDQFLDRLFKEKEAARPPAGMASELSLLKEGAGLGALARLLGTSEFLWEDFLRMQFENLLPVLEEFKGRDLSPGREALRRSLAEKLKRASGYEEQKGILNRFKDREMFFIDMKHLLEPEVTLIEFSHALTDLAEAVLEKAVAVGHRRLMEQHGPPMLVNGQDCTFALFGLGKFGGREMGYASDIELLFVYGGPGRTRGPDSIENEDYFRRLVRELTEFIEARQEGIFQIDLRLRPYGASGPLASSIEQFMAYYGPKGGAAPFERQALIKLRGVAGDERLGRRVEAHRDAFVYSGEPWDLAAALHLRERQRRELVRPGRVDAKHSAGGIIDIEYAVQYLQILHGKDHPELRTPSTLEALDRLLGLRIITKREHQALREAYLFLRTLIDALRIVRGSARDLVLPDPDSEAFKFLARRMGYRAGDWARAARALAKDIRSHMAKARRFFEGRFKPS